MMAIIIISISAIALLHFLYEGIVLPSIRMHLRNRLFELRDELRRERIVNPKECKKEVFLYLDEGIGRFVNNLARITPSTQASAHSEFKSNEKLREATIKRLSMIESSDSETVKRIFKDVNGVIEKAFIANIGIWFVYLVPIALVCLGFSHLAKLSQELIAMPPRNVDSVLCPA